jgi:membrane-associated HD superfamily phosphohydrolase
MDILGAIFIAIFLVIIIYSNFYYLKKLQKNETHLKKKLFYFSTSVIFPCLIVFATAAILSSPALIELTGLKTDMSDYTTRIVFGSVIFPSSILANICFAKFYLKRISKTKNKNEIELIGTE